MAEGINAWLRSVYDRLALVPVSLPALLLTGTTNPRLRVDVGQTGFFENREFRTFREFSQPLGTHLAAGTTYVLKAVVPINVILFDIDISLDNGQVRIETVVGGTEGGTFTAQTIFRRNNMAGAPAYTGQVTVLGGGTHTGGTLLDVLRLKVENSTGAAASVGNIEGDERGVAANTYYFRVNNIGTGVVEGTLKVRWEERP